MSKKNHEFVLSIIIVVIFLAIVKFVFDFLPDNDNKVASNNENQQIINETKMSQEELESSKSTNIMEKVVKTLVNDGKLSKEKGEKVIIAYDEMFDSENFEKSGCNIDISKLPQINEEENKEENTEPEKKVEPKVQPETEPEIISNDNASNNSDDDMICPLTNNRCPFNVPNCPLREKAKANSGNTVQANNILTFKVITANGVEEVSNSIQEMDFFTKIVNDKIVTEDEAKLIKEEFEKAIMDLFGPVNLWGEYANEKIISNQEAEKIKTYFKNKTKEKLKEWSEEKKPDNNLEEFNLEGVLDELLDEKLLNENEIEKIKKYENI